LSVLWNPWHGCRKISPGCRNCYVYRADQKYDRISSQPHKNKDFDLPVRKKRDGSYKIPPGELVFTCFTSDFLLSDADQWRDDAWDMIRRRSDLHFLFITKRIDRFEQCIPTDWGSGWNNVSICCTTENQQTADYRLPIFLEAPIRHKSIACEPLLERIDIERYLGGWIDEVLVGGESGPGAAVCDYDWVLDIRQQCIRRGVAFSYHQTGAKLLRDGKLYEIPRKYQHTQAKKAGIDTTSG